MRKIVLGLGISLDVTSHVRRRGLVSKLRKRPGKKSGSWVGGELVRDFLKADLVDELYIGVVPVLLGERYPAISQRLPAT